MQYSVFLREFADNLLATAAEKGYQYALVDGELKKGKWRTMPNGIHVFIIDGKIEAGPKSAIGKSPDELDWEEVADEEKNSTDTMPRKDVQNKYLQDLLEARRIKDKDSRNSAVDRVMAKMSAEDEFHVIFLRTGKKPSPFLKELSKDFAEYGRFPSDGSKDEQVAYFKDRLSLLERLQSALPPDGKKDVHPHIEHINEMLEEYKSKPDTKKPKKHYDEFEPSNPVLPLAIIKIQAALKALVLSVVSLLVEFINEGASNSGNKRLYSFTKDILSRINTSKRENFDKLFEEELSHG